MEKRWGYAEHLSRDIIVKLTITLPLYAPIAENNSGSIQHIINALVMRTHNNFMVNASNKIATVIDTKTADNLQLGSIPENPILLWVYCAIYPLDFCNKIMHQLPENTPQLHAAALNSTLQCITPNISMLVDSACKDKFELSILETLYKRYTTIERAVSSRNESYRNSCGTIKLFKEYILYYICSIMYQSKLLDAILIKTDSICKELNTLPDDNGITIYKQ